MRVVDHAVVLVTPVPSRDRPGLEQVEQGVVQLRALALESREKLLV